MAGWTRRVVNNVGEPMFGMVIFNAEGQPQMQFFGTDPERVVEMMDDAMRHLAMIGALDQLAGTAGLNREPQPPKD